MAIPIKMQSEEGHHNRPIKSGNSVMLPAQCLVLATDM